MSLITLDDLQQILAECAGEDEDAAFDGDILDVSFTDLGYDSLALLETAARVSQRFGIELPDEAVAGLETPRHFLEAVNQAVPQPA